MKPLTKKLTAAAVSQVKEAGWDLLIGNLEIGLSCSLPFAVSHAESFCDNLYERGFLLRRPEAGRIFDRPLAISLACHVTGGYAAHCEGQLVLTATSKGGVTISDASYLQPRLMRWVRTLDHMQALGFDGADDFIGPDGSYRVHMFDDQVTTGSTLIDEAIEVVAKAADTEVSSLAGELWIRTQSMCSDFEVADAPAYVRRCVTGPVPGASLTTLEYSTRDGQPALRAAWKSVTDGYACTVSAKHKQIVRAELTLLDNATVDQVAGMCSSLPCDPHAGGRIMEIVESAAYKIMPDFDNIFRFIDRARASEFVVPPESSAIKKKAKA